MTWAALLRPCTSSGAPFCASITRSKAMPLSRSAAMAFSSAAAERGISQRPKARNDARSSGAPLSAGSVPTSSGFFLSLFQTMTRWSRRLSSASERWIAALRSATRLRSSTFSAAVLARSRIRKIADRSAAPMTPANIASCITSTVPKENSVACLRRLLRMRRGRRRAPPKPRKSRAGSCAGISRVRRRNAAIHCRPLGRQCRNRCSGRNRPVPPDAGLPPACLVSSPPLDCKTALNESASTGPPEPVASRITNHNPCANRREEGRRSKIKPGEKSIARRQYIVVVKV